MSLKIAVIGAGHLGRIHAKLIRNIPDVSLVGVADPSESARQAIAEAHDVPTVEDWRALIGAIDAAIIATPTEYHYEVAKTLIGNQVHLLIEKPVTSTAQQAQHLIRLADEAGVIIQVGQVERFNPAFGVATERVGTPRFVQACRSSGFTFRSTDVGVVLDLMIHDIDLVCHLAQSEVAEVRAVGVSVFGHNEDIAQARIQFENGLVANLTASRCSPQPQRRFEVFGTRGYADIDLGSGSANLVCPPEWLTRREFELDSVDEVEKTRIRDHLFDQIMPIEQVKVEPVNAIQCEQENWVECIFDRTQTLRVPLRDGFRALAVATQIVQQINEHQWSEHQAIRGPLADPAWIESDCSDLARKVA